MTRPKAVMHKVKVAVSKDAGSTPAFAPSSDLWSEEHGHFAFDRRDHHMGNHDYHLVEFVLDDQTGEGLAFPSVPHDAMWVAKVEGGQAKCPDASTQSNYDVVEPICTCDDGQRLIVRNDNPRKEDWSFTLNLKNKADGRTLSWDPIIKNGGTGGG